MNIEGYLIVLKSPEDILASENSRYKGLYRIPPWSQRNYEEGFDDPYVFGNFTDKTGLIPNLSKVRQALAHFTKVVSAESLEIIYARQYHSTEITSQSSNFNFLGYDVAGHESPFWSILADFPFQEADFKGFVDKFNSFGLFSAVTDAEECLKLYIARKLPHYDSPLVLWSVYRVE